MGEQAQANFYNLENFVGRRDCSMSRGRTTTHLPHQYLSFSVSTGFYTWATHGNQQKPGNWEIRKPMSCFPETSQNDELRKPQKPQESETYGNWLTTAIVIIEIEVSFWVSGFPSFWKPGNQ